MRDLKKDKAMCNAEITETPGAYTIDVEELEKGFYMWRERAIKAEAEVERLRLELLKSQTENERLKRVEESAKKLLDSCLEGESENGDEIDYIEQLRAENKKLKQDIRQFYFDHGVLLKENERLKAVAEAALNLLQKEYVDESHLLDELRQALAEVYKPTETEP